MNPERRKSELAGPIQEADIQEIGKGCRNISDGCSGCIVMIAILLCCAGFFGLRFALQGAAEKSNGGIEIHQQPNKTTELKEPLLKPKADQSNQLASYFMRVAGGVFGLAATALGAIVLYGVLFPKQETFELDKGDTPQRTKKRGDEGSNR